MFVYSVKGSTLKFFGALALSLAVLILLVIFVPTVDSSALETGKEITYTGVRSHADRAAFLMQFGWEIASEPILDEKVLIPAEFDKVFVNYNELQKTQGLDLSRYQKKTVQHYRYEITNYGTDETVYANLLIYRGRVIGGDISSASMNGFVCGFSRAQEEAK